MLNERNMIENPNWQEADQLAVYKTWPRLWPWDDRDTNPASGRVEGLNPGAPEYNTNALNHSATLPPLGNTNFPKYI